MKLLALDRFALVLAGCSILAGIAGCRSTRSDSESSASADCSDRTLFQYREGAWTAGRRGPQAESAEPPYRNGQAPQRPASAYAADPDGLPVPYRSPSGGGPRLLAPPHGIAPDELPAAESDEVTARPTLRERFARLWRKRAADEEPGDAPEIAQNLPTDAVEMPANGGGNSRLTARRGADRAPTGNSAADDRLVTQAAPPEVEPRLDRPPRPLPMTPAASASRAPHVSRAIRSAPRAERQPANQAIAQVPGARGPASDQEALHQTGGATMRVVNPPVLQAPPSGVGLEPRDEGAAGLAIPEIRVCRQVRGFGDVVTYDPQKLRPGQPILIYAELEDYRSVSTPRGYRTLTLSTLEVRTSAVDVLARQPLGTAVDLAEVPRTQFFLTHQLTIPEDLPPGEYIFGLCVDDLLGRSSARAEIAVRVMEGRNPRGGTAGISVSARSPASSPR